MGSETMSTERLFIFDTTLRDGRRPRASISRSRTSARSRSLWTFGRGLYRRRLAGRQPHRHRFFAERPKLKQARFTAFGMTKRAGRSAANDPSWPRCWSGGAMPSAWWARPATYQVKVALEITPEENLDNIARSMEAIAAKKREPLVRCRAFL
jgi:2-isopropylmalate synthase